MKVAFDGACNRITKEVEEVILLRNLPDVLDILLVELRSLLISK
jgi:hypothetical protein